MADGRQIRHLLDYNQWAHEKILAAIDGMTDEELAAPRDAYFGSLARNLLHTLNAERVWLARWQGVTPPSFDEPMTTTWREAFAKSHRALHDYIAPMSDADLDRIVEGKNSRGRPFSAPLARLVLHVVNHGTQHRAEAGLVLERIGRSPGNVDYYEYALGHP